MSHYITLNQLHDQVTAALLQYPQLAGEPVAIELAGSDVALIEHVAVAVDEDTATPITFAIVPACPLAETDEEDE